MGMSNEPRSGLLASNHRAVEESSSATFRRRHTYSRFDNSYSLDKASLVSYTRAVRLVRR